MRLMCRATYMAIAVAHVAGVVHAEWLPYGNYPESGFLSNTYEATVFQDELYVGGVFTGASGKYIRKVARWSGADWQPLGAGPDSWPCPELDCHAVVFALAADESFLYVGGGFPSVDGGLVSPYVARWDGVSWSSMGNGLAGPVYEFAIYRGELIAMGAFGMANGLPELALARWDGSTWSPLSSDIDGYYEDIIVWNDRLVVSGRFTQIDGVDAANIASWDGVQWSALGDGLPEYAAGNLGVYLGDLVCPTFMYLNGVFSQVLGQWTGQNWIPHSDLGGNVAIQDLVEYHGELFIGGRFSSLGNNIAVWRGATWQPLEGGLDDGVRDLQVFGDELIVLGEFQKANGEASAFIAAWRSPTPIALLELRAFRSSEGPVLSWQLSPSAVSEWSEFAVQRSDFMEGPYESVSSVLFPGHSGEFTDRTALPEVEYWYRLQASHQGTIDFSRPVFLGLSEKGATYLDVPIPQGELVRLQYRLADRTTSVALGIFDVRGRLVRALVSEVQPQGEYHLTWEQNADNGARVGPGVYIARLSVGRRAYSQKFIVHSR